MSEVWKGQAFCFLIINRLQERRRRDTPQQAVLRHRKKKTTLENCTASDGRPTIIVQGFIHSYVNKMDRINETKTRTVGFCCSVLPCHSLAARRQTIHQASRARKIERTLVPTVNDGAENSPHFPVKTVLHNRFHCAARRKKSENPSTNAFMSIIVLSCQ